MQFKYLNQTQLPFDEIQKKFNIRDLSAIDYDPITDTYIAQSDYGADGKPTSIYYLRLTGFYNTDGSPKIEVEKQPLDLSAIGDVDSIRLDGRGDGFWVSTTDKKSIIYHHHKDGTVTRLTDIPNSSDSDGVENTDVKKISASPSRTYYVLSESEPEIDESGYARITKFDENGDSIAQYAYRADQADSLNKATNSVSSILAIKDDVILVMEKRATSHESAPSQVKIYQVNLEDNQNISGVAHLTSENTPPVSKSLLLDSSNLSDIELQDSKTKEINDVQGMTLGPALPDGRSSLLLFSTSPETEQKQTEIHSFAVDINYDSLQLHYLNQVGLVVGYTFTDPTSGISYVIGGLSGIDYDPLTNTYIAVSDHQPGTNESVVYHLKLNNITDANATPSVEIISATPLKNENGVKLYDAESIRYDPNGDGYWVTTEETIPSVYHYHSDGTVTKVAVPNNIATRAQDNLSLEGATFAPDGSYYISMERNLKDDATGYSRITKYDAKSNIVAQYAYYTDRPLSIDATSNGISEILALNDTTLLVMERGDNRNQTGVTEGKSRNRVRIYEVSLTGAQNVLDVDYLTASNTTALTKKLVFDSTDPSIANLLNTNETKIDNIEGMTLGPKLADGRQTLVLVTDNNFNAAQYKTQFLSLVLDDGDACFLAGTFIQTQNGQRRVEDIIPGDMIYYLNQNGIWCLREVTWIGSQTASVSAYKPRDLAGYPVCIRRNALDEGVPFADLYVTAEHCMYIDDYFVPIRLLVNDKSIFYDKSFETYEYFHIELDKHSIIMANGALSESYLDTGNRHYFKSKFVNNDLSVCSKNWDDDAAAMLITKRGGIDQLYKSLDLRADRMGIDPINIAPARNNDPALYLITDSGCKIKPKKITQSEVLFEISSDAKNVRLVSKTYRPCDVQGNYVDDRTEYGVQIGKIILHEDQEKYDINIHLTEPNLSGWLPHNDGCSRWTSGNAHIPLTGISSGRNSVLSLQIVGMGLYVVNE